jgi:hypothetical protein
MTLVFNAETEERNTFRFSFFIANSCTVAGHSTLLPNHFFTHIAESIFVYSLKIFLKSKTKFLFSLQQP